MIEILGLQVDYETTLRAVDNITFTVPCGAIYGLIGDNGAGKTSTMRAIMGLTDITHGSVFLNGIDAISDRDRALAKTGFMPDFGVTMHDLKLWEFLDLFAASYGIEESRRPELIDYYLQLLNLYDKKNDFTKGISRGMSQRLMLAKTLIADPDILILDEPASGLDPTSRMLLKNIIKDKQKEGKTTLISSHVLPDLQDICDQVGIMSQGKMIVTGDIANINKQLFNGVKYKIQVENKAEIVIQLIDSSSSTINDIETDGNTITFTVIDEDSGSAVNEILSKILKEGIFITAFNKKDNDLELLMSKTPDIPIKEEIKANEKTNEGGE